MEDSKHGPRAVCIPYSVSFLMRPSKEAGASFSICADGRILTLGWGRSDYMPSSKLPRESMSVQASKPGIPDPICPLMFLTYAQSQGLSGSEAFVGKKEQPTAM